jgi:hypothetical protein
MKKSISFVLLLAAGTGLRAQIRQEILLEKGWKFSRNVDPTATGIRRCRDLFPCKHPFAL